jgi:hypothetical protein
LYFVVALTLRRWSLEEWLSSATLWSDLLARSGADPLFLSWEWLTDWWRCFGIGKSREPNILACYRGERLVGIAPFYKTVVLRGRLLPARSMQFIGLSWRDPTQLISEYLDVIALPEQAALVREACVRALLDEGAWSELVIGYTGAAKCWRKAFSEQMSPRRHYVRELDRAVSYQADLSGGFDGYLRSLGQSTRRSIWNLRRRLDALGRVRLEHIGPDDIAAGFQDLNRLHQLRWNRPAFTGRRLEFHTGFAVRLASCGELALSRLRVGRNVVSVLYDIRKAGRQYNIKQGFDPAFASHLSLGLLHLGYALEAAAANRIGVYDFLAGRGQRTNFKHNLSQLHVGLSSVQMLRGMVLPTLYRWRGG